jgi:hypothetical protein
VLYILHLDFLAVQFHRRLAADRRLAYQKVGPFKQVRRGRA